MSHIKIIERSIRKNILSSACSSEDYNRSSVKRLFSSVFSIIDNDDHQISCFDNEEAANDRIPNLFKNQLFLEQVCNKIRIQGFLDGYHFPILKVSCRMINALPKSTPKMDQINIQTFCELDYHDLCRIFVRFGQLNKLVIAKNKNQAYVFFNSFVNAYVCFKLMKKVAIRGQSIQIQTDWVNPNEVSNQMSSHIHMYMNSVNWEQLYQLQGSNSGYYIHQEVETNFNQSTAKQTKLTCRYEIQIENEKQFQVARRIIGSKGCNMKRIIEESIASLRAYSDQNKSYLNQNVNELLKLRLRGKGSGYKEGPDQLESQESLHLCVSAKDQNAYSIACEKVERLLEGVYSQYLEFTKRQGQMISLSVKKINIPQIASNAFDDNAVNYTIYQQQIADTTFYPSENDPKIDNYRISPAKISQLLELRNKARRQLNFLEADRIRNYLRSYGVCLIDEKGRRGKAADVTTWKYIF